MNLDVAISHRLGGGIMATVVSTDTATLVRRIFQMYADGLGLKRIAKALNAERVSPPRRAARGRVPTANNKLVAPTGFEPVFQP